MRKFSSYGPVNTNLHYYAPRAALIDQAYTHLVGETPEAGGHYITMWGPRQTGKTWVMQQVYQRLQREHPEFLVIPLSLQSLMADTDAAAALPTVAQELGRYLGRTETTITVAKELEPWFRREALPRPVILILDEFDALPETALSGLTGVFRNIYIHRQYQGNLPSGERDYLLHAVALIGVRAALGVENPRGSPFNVQRSLHIPNLTADEVRGMYHDYERESGQAIEPAVIERVFYETQGQPGLVSWLGELLTETYNATPTAPLTMAHFEEVYSAALQVLPNNNILNIISKARQYPYQDMVLELFRTHEPLEFAYDDPRMNFLYLNGVIDWIQTAPNRRYVKFPCPFVQKRLFNYFAYTLFRESGQLYPPFADLSDAITDDRLFVAGILRRYETYLRENRGWLLKDAPRRSDLRVYAAVFHFSLYRYLASFLEGYGGQVVPEFPTGNGQIDLLLRYAGQSYALEVKSYTTAPGYRLALQQAAHYGQQLGLAEVTLALFVEAVDDANRAKYEAVYTDATTGVVVRPVFVQTGE